MPNFDPCLGPDGHGAYRLMRWVNGGLVRRFLRDLDDPQAATKRRLSQIVKGMRGTAFMAEHGGAEVSSLERFRAAIPIRSHTELKPWLDRLAAGERGVLTRQRPTMLLETSGTTGSPKHLPVTRAWAERTQEAQRLWTLGLIRDHESLTSGKALTMVSPAVHGESVGGLPIGSNTGRIRAAQPGWLKKRYVVPDVVAEIPDPVVRQYVALRFACVADVRTITTANPSLLLLLFRRLEEWGDALRDDIAAGGISCGPAAALEPALRTRIGSLLKPAEAPDHLDPSSLWNLASINCWTNGPAEYFAERLRTVLPDVPIRELGVTASEGTFAIPLRNDWPGSVLWTGGPVMEFLSEDGTVKWAWELEEGERARLVITTSAGLARYDMADEIEVVGWCHRTPMVRFVGKTGRYLNRVGERVTAGQVSAAMRAIGVEVVGFTVCAQGGDVPFYVLAIEGENVEPGLVNAFDSSLSAQNVEYAGKRRSGRLGLPVLRRLEPGHYANLRARRVAQGAPEGQLKDPILALSEREWDMFLNSEQSQ